MIRDVSSLTPPPLPKKRKWFFSPLFLVGMNSFIPLVLVIQSRYYNPFALTFGIISIGFYFALCTIWHGPLYYFDTRKRLPEYARVILYLLPTIAMFLLPILGVRPPQEVNQQSPSLSPSGRYEARVGTEKEGWVFIFKEKETGTKSEMLTDFVPHFKVYWHWDQEDRLWAYNSDNQMISYFVEVGGKWERRPFRNKDSEPKPPEELLPDYAKGRPYNEYMEDPG